MTSAPSGRIPALDILRVVAVAGVVTIHVFAATVENDSIRGSGTWWVAVALDIGFIWVVPAFVMVSGALLLTQRMQGEGPAVFYRKRLLRLGPAFVFWQLFYIVVVRTWMTGQELGLGAALGLIAGGRTYTHLYFLWLIVGLYAVAPVLWPFLRDGGRRRAVILATCVILATAAVYTIAALFGATGSPRPINLTALTQWLPYVGYFVAGAAFAGIVVSSSRAIAMAVGVTALLGFAIWEYGVSPDFPAVRAALPVTYTSVVTAGATIGIFLLTQRFFAGRVGPAAGRVWRTLSDASFGVFLVHFVIMIALRMLLPDLARTATESIGAAVLMWLAVVILSFAVSLASRRIPFVRRVF
ncbi:acyltransferase [Microbacterium gallinarum]|uniref:Acyltransferase family protein n=1 Tax=Microbacterium gallinarum TaxID=2762209 RepID=A0ABR8X056_9MICO|nr:acyltransferase family protein [Microbacterium gallinarum]MBD8022236.1 acyltransferase family protein [Microbacterium gallinarum]